MLDNRNKNLLSYPMEALKWIESHNHYEKINMFTLAAKEKPKFTHTNCFRIVFWVGYVISFLVIIYSALGFLYRLFKLFFS